MSQGLPNSKRQTNGLLLIIAERHSTVKPSPCWRRSLRRLRLDRLGRFLWTKLGHFLNRMVAAELDAQNEDDLVSISKNFFSLSLPERQNKLERFSLAKPVYLVLKYVGI